MYLIDILFDVFKTFGWAGVALALLGYMGYDKLKMWLKKRNGGYVGYEQIKEKVSKVEFDGYKQLQNQINSTMAENVKDLKKGVDEVWIGVGDIRKDISELKNIMIAQGGK